MFRGIAEVLNGGPFYTVEIDGIAVRCASKEAALDLIDAHRARVEAARKREFARDLEARQQAATRTLTEPASEDVTVAALRFLYERQGKLVPVDELVTALGLRGGRGLSAVQRTIAQRLEGHAIASADVVVRERVKGHRYWTAGPKVAEAMKAIEAVLAVRAQPATVSVRGDVLDGKTGKIKHEEGP